MSLTRRDGIALLLILVAACFWVFGQQMVSGNANNTLAETTYPGTIEANKATEYENTSVVADLFPTLMPTQETNSTMTSSNRGSKAIGFLLCFAAAAAAVTAVFPLRQQRPLSGPDGVAALAFAGCREWFLQFRDLPMLYHLQYNTVYLILFLSLLLFCVREIWGWSLARAPLSWCLTIRFARRCAKAQIALLGFTLWILILTVACTSALRSAQGDWFSLGFGSTAAVFGMLCLWRYGTDLEHLKKQLKQFWNSTPVSVRDGAFSQEEIQLQALQRQHEEAIHTAITSERFKVDLISNVSHDLRTPLTSILGYSELLQTQTLTPDGSEQLRRLRQKAGYMQELVDALFELTKVSSGVLESKPESLDLIRLWEQTIGLMDDQLNAAGLCVRRHYGQDSVPVVTDGTRMHQVFANLLGNAIKYAMPETRIHLEVTEKPDSIQVRLVNTASYEMDFEPDEILQRFARGDKARSTQGSGLGLAIAQTYTESVGGSFRISIDGDQFSAIVTLPKN